MRFKLDTIIGRIKAIQWLIRQVSWLRNNGGGGGGGGSYTPGTGIDITNDVITNTAPNVVQTLSIAGNSITLSNGGGTIVIPNTSLFDDIFIFNLADNPNQEFELSFLPYQIVTVLDNNQMKWFDDGDYEVNGQTLKMLYPLENETKLRINYYHNL